MLSKELHRYYSEKFYRTTAVKVQTSQPSDVKHKEPIAFIPIFINFVDSIFERLRSFQSQNQNLTVSATEMSS